MSHKEHAVSQALQDFSDIYSIDIQMRIKGLLVDLCCDVFHLVLVFL